MLKCYCFLVLFYFFTFWCQICIIFLTHLRVVVCGTKQQSLTHLLTHLIEKLQVLLVSGETMVLYIFTIYLTSKFLVLVTCTTDMHKMHIFITLVVGPG